MGLDEAWAVPTDDVRHLDAWPRPPLVQPPRAAHGVDAGDWHRVTWVGDRSEISRRQVQVNTVCSSLTCPSGSWTVRNSAPPPPYVDGANRCVRRKWCVRIAG